MALILVQWVCAVELTSSNPYWIGASSGYGSTEGNDFWVTFMRNGGTFDPSISPSIKFELKIAVSARQNTRVYFEIEGSQPISRDIIAGQTHIEDLSAMFPQIYLMQSEVAGMYKGVHVYTDESNKSFSCFNYSRYGEAGVSSRDATLVIPTKYMGKEYYVQTYYEDAYSSQFAIVATEDNTVVHITPAYQTLTGQPAGVTYQVTLLHAGDAYMVASASHQENNVNVDLSGSQICADKPIAVFNGNQETSIPFHESNSVDYLSEQILPITQWGTDFYLALMGNTNLNYFILTAAYDNTHITINTYSVNDGINYPEDITLQAGQTLEPYFIDDDLAEVTIHSDQPIMCYGYTTSASKNEQCTGTSPRNKICYYYGDPANALMPSWAHRVTEMNFFTHDLDPFQEASKPAPPQKYYVFVITKWADRDKLTIDGTGDYSAQFHQFRIAGDEEMAYASIEVTNNSNHYHTIETTGEGFVGMAYGVSDAQGYLYTLGYSPEPFRDSLFVTNTGNVMSPKSYDVQPRLEQGWYQRQWKEWVSGHERIDTAQICDGDSITWLLQSAISKQTEPVDWYIYDVTGTEQTIHKSYTAPIAQKEGATKDEATNTDWLYRWGHKFVMPDESDLPPEERTPFLEYEIQAVMHQKHVICNLPDDLDTLRMVVRVTRVYHDTIYKIICMGDTLKCFNDSLPRQNAQNNDSSYLDNLPQYRTNSKSETLFIGDKTAGNATQDFTWKARPGENSYTRHYETTYGCDSTYTLFLFVCDTFRTIDTIHLCKNEAVTYLDDNPSLQKKYKGVEYEGNGTLVTQDTVDIIRTKTRFCSCQLAPYNNNYPAFEGCDSIFEVHVFIHNVSRDTLVDTMCYNRTPDSVYIWPIQKGTDEIRITKSHPKMTYDAGLRAWIGFFSDTLRTTTCPACNEGRGCDSINVLKLYIPEPFYKEEEDSICQWSYDRTNRQKVTNIYQWEGHRKGAAYVELPRGGVYYDSCLTRFGCDSIYQLKLHYTQPFLHVDFASIANNRTYTWHGKTYGPFPELKDVLDTTLYFYNDNEDQTNPVNGCDSIYRLDLHISDTYLFRSTRSICDIDSIHWRDTVIVGSKWQGAGSFDIRLSDSLTTTIDDSLTTIALPARDSIYRLIVTQYPTYDTTLHCVNICQDQTVYNWVREDDGTLIQQITLPAKSSYPFDTIYTDTLPTRTPHACDSILHLPIRIYPTYDTTTTIVLCEEQLPYTWELRDAATHDKTINIPDADRGSLWHYTEDFVLTTVNGCDSTVHLDLTVKPTLRCTLAISFCPETMPYTYGVHGKQASISGVYNDTTTSVQYGCDSITTYDITVFDKIEVHVSKTICDDRIPYTYELNDTVPAWQGLTETGDYPYVFHRPGLCDSTVILHLTVNPVHRDTLDIRVCQNPDGYPYENLNNGAGGTLQTRYLSDSLTRVDTIETVLGCDSIITLHFYVDSVYNYTRKDTVCQQTGGEWIWYEDGIPQDTITLDKGDTTWLLGTRYHTIHNCDSTYGMEVYVAPVYHIYDTVILCEKDSLHWQKILFVGNEYANYGKTYDVTPFDSAKLNMTEGVYDYSIGRKTILGCDSVHHLHLIVNPVRRVTIERRTCQNTTGYEYENLHNGSGGTLPARYLRDSLTRMDTIPTTRGCDSIITLRYYVDSVYSYTRKDTVCQQTGGEWIWYEDGIPQLTITLDKGDTTWFLGTRYQTIHGCDSTYGIEVYVAPTYHIYDTIILCENDSAHWQKMLFTGSEYANYGRTYTETDFDSIKTSLAANNYDFSIRRGTKLFNCDSVHHLHLIVNPVRHVTIERRTCQNATGYEYENLNNGMGGILPARYLKDSLTRMDTIPTARGCDSIITLRYYVDSVYDYRQTYAVCQDTVNTQWEWIDDEGHSHGFINIADSGDFSFNEAYTTIHGCDSLYGLKLRVKPIYRFDSAYVICENEQLVWQGRTYSGLSVGMHYDTARYSTYEDCDSIFYMQVLVHPVFDTTSYYNTCANETFVWHQQDHNGTYHHTVWNSAQIDTVFLYADEAAAPAAEVPHLKYQKDTVTIYRDTMLQTIHGCDSLSRLRLTVHPAYFFYTDSTICSTDRITYRGKTFPSKELKDTTYTEILKTADGCDSIYQLHLHIKPAYLYTRIRHICDNETLIFPEDGRKVWEPGDPIPEKEDYLDFTYTTYEGCDSTYRYYVSVHPTYYQEREETFCSADSVLLQGNHYIGIRTYFDVTTCQQPIDTVFTDSLTTVHGCDSVFRIKAHILPQYHHLDADTICDDGSVTWRNQVFENLAAGRHVFYDSLKTKAGCDSVYELRIYVAPTYYSEERITKCADENLTWREHNLDHHEAGDFLIADSLLTDRFGCDSVFHLYLTVLDTTSETIYDTICRTEQYDLHGRKLTLPGFYKDTTLNEWGCRHFTYLFLEVIEPIVPTAWADSICADDLAYDLYYTYTGDFDPVAYSVYYDEVGHSYGFEDIENMPITTREELSVLTLPMPLIEGDRTKYPKPDYYPIRLVLDNGICTTPELCDTDTTIVLSYPSWITEQRFGDVIALYNDRYNGGYQWDGYQWYHGDEMLVGETHEYLYIPTGLIVGDRYHVRLTRTGETVDFQTCPITIVGDPVSDDFAPKKGYLSVVPTCIVTGHPYANILSRKDGMYRVTSSEGRLVKEGVFRADVTEVELPSVSGLYIFQLWSPDTPEEPYRSIKVIVKEKCEGCNIPF